MVLGSYYMWWRLKKHRRSGVMVCCPPGAKCDVFISVSLIRLPRRTRANG